jgi:phosphatidylserine/phosphatidylglycerophosphate/cardiolipin synthase-like enzyme
MPLPGVVQYANSVEKPDARILEKIAGIKVCTAMLKTSGREGQGIRYREIYIHSKLLMVDDVFCTVGSANVNQRSMVSDSEINMVTIDPSVTSELRKKIWAQLLGGDSKAGGKGTKAEISETFKDWINRMNSNKKCMDKGMPMTGFLLPLEDKRSSTLILG